MDSLAATPITHQSDAEPVAISALETSQSPQRNNTSAPRISQHSSPAARLNVLPPTPGVEHSSLDERRVTFGRSVPSLLACTFLGGGIGFVARDCFAETALTALMCGKVISTLKLIGGAASSTVMAHPLVSGIVVGGALFGLSMCCVQKFISPRFQSSRRS
jgi:hypothetical protein